MKLLVCGGREGQALLKQTMGLAFYGHSGGAVAYAVRGEPPTTGALTDWSGHPQARRLILFWSPASAPDVQGLPFKLDAEGASDFAWRWLQQEDFGRQPDHDGHNTHGWRLYNEAWGHVDGDHYAFVGICPAWAMYGK